MTIDLDRHKVHQIVCGHCKTKVAMLSTPGDHQIPKYCSERCQKRAKNKRWVNRKGPFIDRKKCTEDPRAKVFRDNSKGWRYARRAGEALGNREPYLCECGGLHLRRIPEARR